MVYRRLQLAFMLAAGLVLAGCGEDEQQASRAASGESSSVSVDGRWYTESQVTMGRGVFRNNCAACHGGMGQGGANWRQRDASGNFPPPPLNGSGHTWHHPYGMLADIITNGGQQNMPAFGPRLSDEEIEAVLAYVMSMWPEKVYETWAEQVNNRS